MNVDVSACMYISKVLYVYKCVCVSSFCPFYKLPTAVALITFSYCDIPFLWVLSVIFTF